jgi:16S rRNA (uracil1498-N3)-methyltransferase
MHRFYLPPAECSGPVLTLTGREAHHALRVLRVQRGERVTVLDGAGIEFLCDVRDAGRSTVELSVVEKKSIPPLPYQITLLPAIPKGKLIEAIIEKATELGAHRIVPILSERVTTRLDDADAAEKAEKWRLVAIEAIKQCGSAWLPQVDTPMKIEEFLRCSGGRQTAGLMEEKCGFLPKAATQFDLSLVGSLQPGARHPRECLRAFTMKHGAMPRSVAVWIGPEGDFTLEELRVIQAAGAQPISLGKLVLRVETAAIYCLSFLNYELESIGGK